MPSLLSLRLNPPLEYSRDEQSGQNPQQQETQSKPQNLHTVNPTPETARGQLPSLLSLRLNQSPTYPFTMPHSDVGSLKYSRQPSNKQPHEAFIAATIGQESGGDYSARSGKDKKGREAYGKYQVMDFNIPSWTKQFYGRELTPEQFLADRQAQDAVGRGRLKELFDKYGVEDGASYYFSGGPLAKNANKKDKNGKTVASYVADIKRRFQQELSNGVGPQVASAAESLPQENGKSLPSLLSLRLKEPFTINRILDDQAQSAALLKGAKDLLLGPRPKTYGEAKERGLIPLESNAINLPPDTPVPDNAKFLDAFGMIGSMNNVSKGLTTKLLERLKTATKSETVTKQFIEDLTNQADIKQPEKDLFRRILGESEDVGNRVSPQATERAIQLLNEKGLPVKSGEDLVTVYHGTNAKGVKGIDSSGNFQPFSYFATDPEAARMFSFGRGGKVYESKVKVKDLGFAQDPMAGAKGITFQSPYTLVKGADGVLHTAAERSNQIHLPTFIDKVESELLPLKALDRETSGGGGSRNIGYYEQVVLPDELRGEVESYGERIYQSPIKTSAGDVHYAYLQGGGKDNYFAHTRIEDLPDNQTRRVIEAQSDLFQKGRLEGESAMAGSERMAGLHNADDLIQARLTDDQYREYRKALTSAQKSAALDKIKPGLSDEIRKEVSDLEKGLVTKRHAEIAKLEPYRNTWHERIIREEVKQAAKDGKTKLQFPTGETAMKIEGLGHSDTWLNPAGTRKIDESTLKVGEEIRRNGTRDNWIITDILGDGKFKAVQKDAGDFMEGKDGMEMQDFDVDGNEISVPVPDHMKETFDISGKVDTNNPIYKFYEKEVGRYLKNKYNATLITDPQGVKWWEVNVPKGAAKMPIEAFGIGALPFITQKDEDSAKMK